MTYALIRLLEFVVFCGYFLLNNYTLHRGGKINSADSDISYKQ